MLTNDEIAMIFLAVFAGESGCNEEGPFCQVLVIVSTNYARPNILRVFDYAHLYYIPFYDYTHLYYILLY